jgi:hypothetical protein
MRLVKEDVDAAVAKPPGKPPGKRLVNTAVADEYAAVDRHA